MMDTIIIKEYDQLQIRDKRDVVHNVISKEDALALQSIIMDSFISLCRTRDRLQIMSHGCQTS